MKLLTIDDIELIHIQIIDVSGGSHGTRDRNRISSAVNSMCQEVFRKELYPTIYDKAAVLLRGIICDHPFVDGNKRTGIISAIVLLNLNNIITKGISDTNLEEYAVFVATKKPSVQEISAWLKAHRA